MAPVQVPVQADGHVEGNAAFLKTKTMTSQNHTDGIS